MIGNLLLRGMLVGVVAGILCFAFLKVVGEPPVDRAIAFETQMNEAKEHAQHDQMQAQADTAEAARPEEEAEPELVSRTVQAGIGLFTGVTVYSAAFGGLFALAFALAYGRMGDLSPRGTSALVAAAGLVAIYIVPNLKYPANPPAVGNPDTIGMRTAYYFLMIAISLVAIIGAGALRKKLSVRHGQWNASLIAGLAYLVVVLAAAFALPAVNEVPDAFPAVVLWQFRMASLGSQVLLWATLGLLFGALTDRSGAFARR